MTNNLERRIYEHKNKMIEGFTKRYNVDKLVYFEFTGSVEAAIKREKEIKGTSKNFNILCELCVFFAFSALNFYKK